MKRAREPLGYLASLNQDIQRSAPTDAQGKRGRPKHQRALSTSNSNIVGSLHDEHDIDLGPFRGLLAAGGIIWTSEHEARGGDVAMDGRREQGYACRSNPSKLRLAVEKALVHDPARQREFVEGMQEFMSGPLQTTLRRALLPLDCGERWGAGHDGGRGGRGSSVFAAVAASAVAASAAANSGSGVNAIHESLIKVLLRVDCVQPEVIDMLLEKLPEIVAAEDDDPAGGAPGSFSQDLPRLVLNQVRFLDHLVDSASLTKKLLECVTVLPLGLQREMISYLPEVVEDGDHAIVVETLQSLRESEPDLLVSVLDALGNLSLPSPLLGDITSDALGLLESAEPSTLPVLVRFLLETSTMDTAEEVVRELREKLRLCPLSGGAGNPRGGVGTGLRIEDSEETDAPWFDPATAVADNGSSGDALTLEALRQGLRLRSDLSGIFLKAIARTDGSEGHSVVDMWALFCLHANKDTQKKVVALFRRKIGLGHFTEALMSDALQGRAGALHGLFQSLLGITDALVSSGALATRRYGASMYQAMFQEFSELYHRQEVVGALLTHAGAGSVAETDSALAALSSLANAPPDARGGLRPFAAFIRGLLDYTQGFTHNQVRQVFRILCAMAAPVAQGSAVEGGGSGGRVGRRTGAVSGTYAAADLDDVHIFIRKHVAMSQLSLKRIGIIGAVAFVEFQGKSGGGGGGGSGGGMLSQDSAASSGVSAASADTLDMLLSHCQSSQDAKAFLYDELALSAATGALSGEATAALVNMLFEPLSGDFLNVVGGDDLEEEEGESGGTAGEDTPQSTPNGNKDNLEDKRFNAELCGGAVKSRPFGDLDHNPKMIVEVLLLPLLASEDPQERAKVGSLCPLFSLLSACYRAGAGMREIDATLGAAIILADSQTVDRIGELDDSQKDAILGAHLAACNWIRELINAFVVEPTQETRCKMVRRVRHLCRLEMDLVYMLRKHPGFRLPGHGGVTGGDKPPVHRGSSKASGVGAGATKGKGKAKAPPARKAKKTEGEMADTTRDVLRGVMRPLSPEAVLVLSFPNMLLKTRNTQGETCHVEPVRVGLRGVHLLLQEMYGHLKRGLAPTKSSANLAFARLREAAASSGSLVAGTDSRPTRPALELVELYLKGGVFRSFWNLLEMVGKCLGGVEEDLESIAADVEDDDMLLPCLEITLKVLTTLCGSDELLGSSAGRDLLRRCLADAFEGSQDESFSSEAGHSNQRKGGESSFELCFDRLEDYASTVQELPLAVQLVQVMEAVATARIRFLDGEDRGTRARGGDDTSLSPHQKLSALCLTLLQRDWSGGDVKFIYKSSTVGTLVRAHLRWAKDPLEAVEVMSTEMLPLLLETGDCLGPTEGYPTLTAASFTFYFTPLLQALANCWRNRTDFFARPRLPTPALLMRAQRMVLVFRLLVGLTKGNPTLSRRPALLAVLKEGKKFLQAFLRSISVLEQAFQANQGTVLEIFTHLQYSTRHMQSLCAHGKDLADASMSKEAPVVKRLLEEFIFRVRSLVQSNDCLGALKVGILKNRDIEGKILHDPVEDSDEEEKREDPDDVNANVNANDKSDESDSDSDGEEDGHEGMDYGRQEEEKDNEAEEEDEEDSGAKKGNDDEDHVSDDEGSDAGQDAEEGSDVTEDAY